MSQNFFVICCLLCLLYCGQGCSSLRVVDLSKEPLGEDAVVLEVSPQPISKSLNYGQFALRVVFEYWGVTTASYDILSEISQSRKIRLTITAKDLASYAENYGFHAFLLQLDLDGILEQLQKGRPVIILRKRSGTSGEYLVVTGFDPQRKQIYIADTSSQIVACSYRWMRKNQRRNEQFALLLVKKDDG